MKTNKAVSWAKELIRKPFYVLDFETTGLNEPRPVSVGIVDWTGKSVYSYLVNPEIDIEPGAERIHGISQKTISKSRTFGDLYPSLRAILENETVIAYNASYEKKVFANVFKAYGLEPFNMNWECAMLQYAEYAQVPNRRHGGYQWQKLIAAAEHFGIDTNGAHGAVADCLMTYKVIKEMSKLA